MKKTKQQKGITLIALILTVVVLMILAAVAISSIQNDGILGHAQNAATTYNQAVANEQSMLQGYEDYLTGANGGFEAYEVGDEVTIGSESFYVIKDSSNKESKVLLLAKLCINTTRLVQSSSANTVEFSRTPYWADGNYWNSSVSYDILETGVPDSDHDAAYYAYRYGKKLGGTGRLMTYSEADALKSNTDMIFGNNTDGYLTYWLGSGFGSYYVRQVDGENGKFSFGGTDMWDYGGGECSVRPVIEISKSKVTRVAE